MCIRNLWVQKIWFSVIFWRNWKLCRYCTDPVLSCHDVTQNLIGNNPSLNEVCTEFWVAAVLIFFILPRPNICYVFNALAYVGQYIQEVGKHDCIFLNYGCYICSNSYELWTWDGWRYGITWSCFILLLILQNLTWWFCDRQFRNQRQQLSHDLNVLPVFVRLHHCPGYCSL